MTFSRQISIGLPLQLPPSHDSGEDRGAGNAGALNCFQSEILILFHTDGSMEKPEAYQEGNSQVVIRGHRREKRTKARTGREAEASDTRPKGSPEIARG